MSRKGWQAFAVILALLAPGWVHTEAQPAGPSLGVLGTPLRHVPFTVVALGAPQGDSLLINGDFDDGLMPAWRATTAEVGTGASVSTADGALLLTANAVARNGTIHASQTTSKPDGGAFRFTYRAASEGRDAMAAQFLLRERNLQGQTLDTQFSHSLTDTMERYDWTWLPKVAGGEVQVFVRFRAVTGLDQAARVDDVELRPAPELAWSVQGGRIVSSGGFTAKVLTDRLGSVDVRADAARLGDPQWTASISVDVANAAPAAALVTSPPVPSLGREILLSAAGTSDADSSVQLQDPSFSQLGTAWLTSSRETGSPLQATATTDLAGRPVLDLAVANAAKAGTVFANHAIPVAGPVSAVFSVGIRDDGGIVRYEFILRERNATGASTDSTFQFASTNGQETVAAMRLEPKRTDTTTVEVYLRFRVAAGASARVSFVQPNLQAGLTYSYFLDGTHLATSGEPLWPVTLKDLSVHEARVEVRDADGATASATLSLQANDPGYVWSVRGPLVRLQHPAAPLDASGTHPAGSTANVVANGDFSAGLQAWTVGKGETGGQVLWETLTDDEGRFARLHVAGNTSGSNYLLQAIDRSCLERPCEVSFAARLVSGQAILEPILRAVVQSAGQPARDVDVRYSPPLGPAWRYNTTVWSPPTDDVVRLQVYLRIRTLANASAVVDFRDVRVGAERSFTWAIDGPGGLRTLDGVVINPLFEQAGPYEVAIESATTVGAGIPATGRYGVRLDVLPLDAFRTHDGLGLEVRGRRPEAGITLLDAQGGVVWTTPVDPLSTEGVARRAPTDPALILVEPLEGARLVLDNGTATSEYVLQELAASLPEPVGTPVLEVEHAGWSSRLRVTLPVNDRSLQSMRLEVREGNAVVAERTVAAQQGNLTVVLDLPTAWSRSALYVTVTTEDAWGRSSDLQAEVPIDRNPFIGPSLLILVVALAVILAGATRAILRRRRSP